MEGFTEEIQSKQGLKDVGVSWASGRGKSLPGKKGIRSKDTKE